MLTKFKHTIRELDLSHNDFTDVSFLDGFYLLSTLILDSNKLDSASKTPTAPKAGDTDAQQQLHRKP